MTPEKQRIAIAEACGWRYSPYASVELKNEAILSWIRPGNADWQPECVPDYLHDLNAMHEAIGCLTDGEYAEYSKLLIRMFGMTRPRYHDATAAQRAEAFLRTLNLWEE